MRSGRSVEIFYQSMNRERPDPIWRRIAPHAFGYDGLRWHARAFSHDEQLFTDFLLTRILEVRAAGEPAASSTSPGETGGRSGKRKNGRTQIREPGGEPPPWKSAQTRERRQGRE